MTARSTASVRVAYVPPERRVRCEHCGPTVSPHNISMLVTYVLRVGSGAIPLRIQRAACDAQMIAIVAKAMAKSARADSPEDEAMLALAVERAGALKAEIEALRAENAALLTELNDRETRLETDSDETLDLPRRTAT